MATKKIPGKRSSVITGFVPAPASDAPTSPKLDKEKSVSSTVASEKSEDDAVLQATLMISEEQSQLEEARRMLEKSKAETAALKASLREPLSPSKGASNSLAEDKLTASNGLAEKRDVFKTVEMSCSTTVTRRKALQKQIAALEKKRLDHKAHPPKARSEDAVAKARPENYTAEGRKLSRLERVRDDLKSQYSTAVNEREHAEEETAKLKEQQSTTRQELEQCFDTRKELQAQLTKAEDRLAAGRGHSQYALDAKIEEGKMMEAKLVELDKSAQQEEARAKTLKSRCEQIKKHPNADGIDKAELQKMRSSRDAQADAVAKGEKELAEKKSEVSSVVEDLKVAREGWSAQQQETKNNEDAAKEEHAKRQKDAYERLKKLAPASSAAGLEIAVFDSKPELLADTKEGKRLIKTSTSLVLAMLDVLLRDPHNIASVKAVEEELVLERGKLEALEVRLASLKTKAALSNRDTSTPQSPRRSRRSSIGSLQPPSDAGTESVDELQARYVRVEQILYILANRHRALVQIEGELKHDVASLELSLAA